MKTEGRGLSMYENLSAGDNMVINTYLSVSRIALHANTVITVKMP